MQRAWHATGVAARAVKPVRCRTDIAHAAHRCYCLEVRTDWLAVVEEARFPHAVRPGSAAVWPQRTTPPSTAPTRLLPQTMLFPQTMLLPQTMLFPQTM